jgi:hypothetical protein
MLQSGLSQQKSTSSASADRVTPSHSSCILTATCSVVASRSACNRLQYWCVSSCAAEARELAVGVPDHPRGWHQQRHSRYPNKAAEVDGEGIIKISKFVLYAYENMFQCYHIATEGWAHGSSQSAYQVLAVHIVSACGSIAVFALFCYRVWLPSVARRGEVQ